MQNPLSARGWDVARGGKELWAGYSRGWQPGGVWGSLLSGGSVFPPSSVLSFAYVVFLFFVYKLFCKICTFGTEAKDEVNLISRLIKPAARDFGPDSSNAKIHLIS